jgi:DNA topoisomerase VI subunit B
LISNLFTVCNSNIAVPSLPSEPAEASPGPHTKGDDEIRQMAEAIMDKVVDQLLNEAAEVVLRED